MLDTFLGAGWVLDAFSVFDWCWMLFQGAGWVLDGCWMPIQGAGCLFRVLDAFLGCWMGAGWVLAVSHCFIQHFYVLSSTFGAGWVLDGLFSK